VFDMGVNMTSYMVAGVSKNNDRVKVRFCSDRILRIKNLQKQGDTDINLVDLPKEMTKEEACQYLLTLEEFKPYYYDIGYAYSQKKLQLIKKAPIIDLPVVEEDLELDNIRELAIA